MKHVLWSPIGIFGLFQCQFIPSRSTHPRLHPLFFPLSTFFAHLSILHGSLNIYSFQLVGIAGTMEQRPGCADFNVGSGLCWKGNVSCGLRHLVLLAEVCTLFVSVDHHSLSFAGMYVSGRHPCLTNALITQIGEVVSTIPSTTTFRSRVPILWKC